MFCCHAMKIYEFAPGSSYPFSSKWFVGMNLIPLTTSLQTRMYVFSYVIITGWQTACIEKLKQRKFVEKTLISKKK